MATATAGRIVPNAVAITEWYTKVNGSAFSQACGQASTAMALHVLNPSKFPTTAAFVTQLAHETLNAGQTVDPPQDSTNPRELKWLFSQHGVSATIHSGDWETTLRAFAGVKPLVVGIKNATAFGGHDAHVHGHYVCVFGVDAKGVYIVGDPNTPQSTSGAFVFYTLAQFQAAEVFAALVPNQDPLASVPVIGGALDSLISPVNQTILHVNGFSDIVAAIAADERVNAPNLSSITDLPGWIFGNTKAWLIRAIVIGVGLLLILAVLIQTIKQADPEFWQSLSPSGQAGQALGGLGGGGGAADAGAAGEGAGIPLEAVAL